jgi:hypothetical protein
MKNSITKLGNFTNTLIRLRTSALEDKVKELEHSDKD